MDPTFTLRRATPADARVVVELRTVMFRAMGSPDADEPGWQEAATAWFEAELAGTRTAVVVAQDARGHVAAAAMGLLRFEAPRPGTTTGVSGLLANVATFPYARRRGLARACVAGVVDWFREETAAETVELFATGEGAGLYEELGFRTTAFPAMRLRLR